MSTQSHTTWLYYVDESHDDEKYCLVALGLNVATWLESFQAIKAYRSAINKSDGVYMSKEIHARDLVKGRGNIGKKVASKYRRSQIFFELLEVIASLPHVHIFNVALPMKDRRDPQLDCWDRLLNRINRTCQVRTNKETMIRRRLYQAVKENLDEPDLADITPRLGPHTEHAVIIADQGRNLEIMRLKRKMSVFNPVPSRLGSWHDGKATKNIPLQQFVEDALFRDSANSYLIQLADCAAFALLKREVTPTTHVEKYQIHRAWDAHLAAVSFKQASPRDQFGIVRK